MKFFSYRSLLVVAAISAALFTSCQKDNVTLHVRMGKFQGDSKMYMNGYSPLWIGGESVVINDQSYTINGSGSNGSISVATAAAYKAVYPADFVVSGTTEQLQLPRLQVYQVESNGCQRVMAPMGAYSSNGTTLQFKPMGALLAITITNSANHGTMVLDKVSVRASSAALWGNANVAGLETATPSYVITDQYQQGVNDSILLAGEGGSSINASIAADGSMTVYLFVPAFNATTDNRFTIRIFSHTDDYECIYSRTQANPYSGNIPVARMASVPFALSSTANEFLIPQGSLGGLFSVSDTKQVRFAKGNLQWSATNGGTTATTHATATGTAAGTWRFAEHQYDMVGNDNANISSSYSGWIDLFGYSTSGWYSGDNRTSYLPYSTGTSDSKYFMGNMTGDYAYADWGVFNAISNGSNTPGMWRTLTVGEWNYLLGISGSSRTDASSKRATGRISLGSDTYVKGLIILPDSWTTPAGCTFTATISDFTLNTYTLDQWALMEEAGAIFLPCAGSRYGTTISFVGNYGYYSTSSAPWSGLSPDYYRNIVYFDGSSLQTSEFAHKCCYGHAVRLCCDVN